MVNQRCIGSTEIDNISDYYNIDSTNSRDFFSDKLSCSRLQFPHLQVRVVEKSENSKIKRRQNEIGLLKFIQHPNLIRLFDVLENGNNIFCILDTFQSVPFEERIRSIDVYSEKLIFRWIAQTCSALSFLHCNDLVHRCLTVESLHFGRNDTLLLDGYYLAYIDEPRLLRSLLQNHPQTCAPEMLRGARGHSTGDIWSLGILIYQLFAGKYPFSCESTTDLYKQILGYDSLELDDLDEISLLAKFMIQKLLKADPCGRLSAASAYELAYSSYETAEQKHLHIPYSFFNVRRKSSVSEFSFEKLDKVSDNIVYESLFNVINEDWREFDDQNDENKIMNSDACNSLGGLNDERVVEDRGTEEGGTKEGGTKEGKTEEDRGTEEGGTEEDRGTEEAGD